MALRVKTSSSGAAADEPGDDRPGGLVRVRGLLGEEVRATVHGGVVLLVELPLGVEHRHRLLRRGAGVEVDQRPPAAHGARQDREVGPQRPASSRVVTPAARRRGV